jgi:hypothetical protein
MAIGGFKSKIRPIRAYDIVKKLYAASRSSRQHCRANAMFDVKPL